MSVAINSSKELALITLVFPFATQSVTGPVSGGVRVIEIVFNKGSVVELNENDPEADSVGPSILHVPVIGGDGSEKESGSIDAESVFTSVTFLFSGPTKEREMGSNEIVKVNVSVMVVGGIPGVHPFRSQTGGVPGMNLLGVNPVMLVVARELVVKLLNATTPEFVSRIPESGAPALNCDDVAKCFSVYSEVEICHTKQHVNDADASFVRSG